MRRNIHYKPSKSASILSGVIACAMGVFGLFTIPSIGAMIGFKAIWCLMPSAWASTISCSRRAL